MKLRKTKIYSQYLIINIIFYWTMIGFLPMVLVFSYMLNLHETYEATDIILVVLAVNIVITILGGLLIFFRRDHLKRRVKTHYRNEFIYLFFISAFSILGSVVLFDYLNGNRDYIANILILITAIVFALLVFLSKKYFKIDYISKK